MFHDCNSACVPDDDTSTCGTSCTPCPDDPNGDPTCDGMSCGLTCDLDYELCAGACAQCPVMGVNQTTCNGAACEATSCISGYLLCNSDCAQCPAGAGVASTACQGGACVAATCNSGYFPCAAGCCMFATEGVMTGGSGSTAQRSDVAIDGGRIYVAMGFNNPSTNSANYAIRDVASGRWSTGHAGSGGFDAKLDVHNGTLRIVHHYGGARQVRIWDRGNTSVIEDRPDNPRAGIAFDVEPSGLMHVLYGVGNTFRSVRYARGGPGAWTKSGLGSGNPAQIDLEVGNDGIPRTVLNQSGALVMRKRDNGAVWSREVVDAMRGYNASLALDGMDRPYVAYYDGAEDDLWFATNDGTGWSTQLVDSAGDVGEFNDIAVDSQGRVHIAYRDETNRDLKYAVLDGTRWSLTTVVSSGDTGLYPSIAVDASGEPHIIYSEGRAFLRAFLR